LNKETYVTAGAGNDVIDVGNDGVNVSALPAADLLPGVDNVGICSTSTASPGATR